MTFQDSLMDVINQYETILQNAEKANLDKDMVKETQINVINVHNNSPIFSTVPEFTFGKSETLFDRLKIYNFDIPIQTGNDTSLITFGYNYHTKSINEKDFKHIEMIIMDFSPGLLPQEAWKHLPGYNPDFFHNITKYGTIRGSNIEGGWVFFMPEQKWTEFKLHVSIYSERIKKIFVPVTELVMYKGILTAFFNHVGYDNLDNLI